MDIKAIFLPIGAAFAKIMNALPDIVLQVEQAMKDGTVTAAERKDLAMYAVTRLCKEWGYSPNWFVRWIISLAIDRIAKALPPKGNDVVVPGWIIKISKDF